MTQYKFINCILAPAVLLFVMDQSLASVSLRVLVLHVGPSVAYIMWY